MNGDGIDDLIIGARGGDYGSLNNVGEAYVVFGSTSGLGNIDLANLTSEQGFIIRGDGAGDCAGISVSSAGDINGDGIDDLIVGAPFGDNGGSNAGEAYVVFGSNTGLTDIDLLTFADGSRQGFIIQGDTAGDQAGRSVSSAGDVNGDGIDDLIIGAPSGDDGGGGAGEAYVIFGSRTNFGNIDLSNLDPSIGFIIQGDEGGDTTGLSVSAAGDLNGDGIDDLIVGAVNGDDGGVDAGEAHVIYGRRPSEEVNRVGSEIGQSIYGGDFDDVIRSLGGDDMLDGGEGNDILDGGEGNDTIMASGEFDGVDGGDGIDIFDLSTSTAGVTTNWVNLEAASSQFRVDSGAGFVGRATLTGIENVSDSSGNDRFFGDSGENTYFYSTGLDTVDGNGGFDTLDISAMTRGFQWIDLQASSFQLRSNDGAGWIANAAITEVENFITTDDIDHFRGDSGDQTIRYIGGRDFIDGRDGSDTIDMSEYDAGNWVNLNIAFDQFRFFNGAGFQSGGNMQNVENVIGGDGNDFFYADGADNFYFGGLGNDRFDGGAGTDTFQVDGVLGDYTLSESGGTYTMSGISGTDTLIDVEQVQIGDTVYDIAALDGFI